jgi:hypothetical protein
VAVYLGLFGRFLWGVGLGEKGAFLREMLILVVGNTAHRKGRP